MFGEGEGGGARGRGVRDEEPKSITMSNCSKWFLGDAVIVWEYTPHIAMAITFGNSRKFCTFDIT